MSVRRNVGRFIMVRAIPALAFLLFSPAVLAQPDGVTGIPSNHSVAASIDRLASLAEGRGMKIFALIDFAADAKTAGLSLRPMQMMIFGNSRAGTPLIVASPTVAIDLPLKVLAWEDADGEVLLSYNTPEYLGNRHRLPEELLKNIRGIETLVKQAAE